LGRDASARLRRSEEERRARPGALSADRTRRRCRCSGSWPERARRWPGVQRSPTEGQGSKLMDGLNVTFEDLRQRIGEAAPAASESDRVVSWIDAYGDLGFSRDERGQVEIFLACSPLEAIAREVAVKLRHDLWYRADGS